MKLPLIVAVMFMVAVGVSGDGGHDKRMQDRINRRASKQHADGFVEEALRTNANCCRPQEYEIAVNALNGNNAAECILDSCDVQKVAKGATNPFTGVKASCILDGCKVCNGATTSSDQACCRNSANSFQILVGATNTQAAAECITESCVVKSVAAQATNPFSGKAACIPDGCNICN